MYRILAILIAFPVGSILQAQSPDSAYQDDYSKTKIINGDTIYISEVPAVYINPPAEFADLVEQVKYQRLVRNVKKAYPYAIVARDKLKEVNDSLAKLKSKKERKAYIDLTEKQLRVQFEDQLKNLTITQGKILIKLVYRETGNTSYELIKEYKGSISALFWQSIARIFGSNLKNKYDPFGEDRDIEDIVIKIQCGLI
jgi:hypothetical protein